MEDDFNNEELEIPLVKGYDIESINSIADEIFQTIVDMSIPTELAILGLLRTVTIIGSPDDFDEVQEIVDTFAEVAYLDESMVDDDNEDDDIEWVDDEADVDDYKGKK